jgi:hypothetical protein
MLYWGPYRHGASESTKRSALRRFSTAFSTSAFSFAIIRGNFATASIRYARMFWQGNASQPCPPAPLSCISWISYRQRLLKHCSTPTTIRTTTPNLQELLHLLGR